MFRLQLFMVIALLCSASQPASAKFTAKLPSGATVELVAVVDLNAEPHVAWQPDGKPCEFAKEWPMILRTSARASHGYVFRCQKFGVGQTVDFRTSPIGSWPIAGESVPEYITMSNNIPAAMKKTSIRVCWLDVWGPRQRFEVDGSRPTVVEPSGLTGKFYSLVEKVELQHSPKSQLKVGVALRGVSGKWTRETEVGQYECFAHDRDGKEHPTRGVMPFGKSQIEFFQVPVEDTDHYTYRMRPVLKWITFDNIAIAADAGTEVKISVEDSKLAGSPTR
jgi:hypothetical protein